MSVDEKKVNEKKSRFVIDKKTAEIEFDNFCDSWEIDNDTASMTVEEKEDFAGAKAKIVNSIRMGRLSIDSDTVDYVVSNKSRASGDKLKFTRPQGDSLMEMDRYKDREGVHKTYAVLASMSGKTSNYFSNLDGVDIKPFIALVTLFLAG